MKRIFLLFSVVCMAQLHAQKSLVKLWSSDTLLPVPESVLYDAGDKLLYVSLIDGDYNTKDGKGEIAKVGLDGKIINAAWVKGLNAPKGLGRYKNYLYAADLTEVAVIDIQKAQVIKRIPVEGAKFLNDITVDANGVVYVSDTETGKVHAIKDGVVTTFLTGIKGANGLLALKDKLFVLANGVVLEAGKDARTTVFAKGLDASTDGIEQVSPGTFIVSAWSGIIYLVTKDAEPQVLLNTTAAKVNSADISFDAVHKIVYVPTFFKNNVVAYQLK